MYVRFMQAQQFIMSALIKLLGSSIISQTDLTFHVLINRIRMVLTGNDRTLKKYLNNYYTL